MNSLSFEQGQIIIAPIPFANQVEAKTRPALVLSNKAYNDFSEDIIVLKVTSKLKDYPFDISLLEKDLVLGKLKSESVIQADYPVVIEKKSIQNKIGTISSSKLQEVKQKIKELFEI